MCLHAQSEDPAVYACVFAILLGCLPLFARMNTNWAEFLTTRDAVVSKILPPVSLSLFLWSLCSWLLFGVTHVPWYCPESFVFDFLLWLILSPHLPISPMFSYNPKYRLKCEHCWRVVLSNEHRVQFFAVLIATCFCFLWPSVQPEWVLLELVLPFSIYVSSVSLMPLRDCFLHKKLLLLTLKSSPCHIFQPAADKF